MWFKAFKQGANPENYGFPFQRLLVELGPSNSSSRLLISCPKQSIHNDLKPTTCRVPVQKPKMLGNKGYLNQVLHVWSWSAALGCDRCEWRFQNHSIRVLFSCLCDSPLTEFESISFATFKMQLQYIQLRQLIMRHMSFSLIAN